MKNSTVKAFEKAISQHRMIEGQRGVLVGYSGGADSSALLHLMKHYCDEHGLYIAALHVHHGIRGDEADRDARFCEDSCKKLGVPLTLVKADIPALAETNGKGLEETAREYRYSAFSDALAKDARLSCIATAHNADDNAETVLFNLARGSGSAGICGIPPVRDLGGAKVIRPLLFTEKSEIVDYCEKNGIEYIFDSTNKDTAYMRNYIRHEIMPLFSHLNPSFLKAVGRMTDSVANDASFVEAEADRCFGDNCKNGGINADVLLSLPAAMSYRMAARLFGECGGGMLERVHYEAVINTAKSGKEGASVSLPQGIRAVICGGRVIFTREAGFEKPEYEYELAEGINRFDGLPFAVLVRRRGDARADLQKDNETLKNIYKLSIRTMVNSDKIDRVLKVRSRQDGDSYVFGGMTRKLKKLYNDRGLSLNVRASLPVFCDGSGIIWVPGFKAADRVSAGDNITEIIYYYNGDNDYDE